MHFSSPVIVSPVNSFRIAIDDILSTGDTVVVAVYESWREVNTGALVGTYTPRAV